MKELRDWNEEGTKLNETNYMLEHILHADKLHEFHIVESSNPFNFCSWKERSRFGVVFPKGVIILIKQISKKIGLINILAQMFAYEHTSIHINCFLNPSHTDTVGSSIVVALEDLLKLEITNSSPEHCIPHTYDATLLHNKSPQQTAYSLYIPSLSVKFLVL